MPDSVDRPWLDDLMQLVESRSLVLLRFDDGEWERLRESRGGMSQFTIARAHDMLEGVKVPTACLVRGGNDSEEELYFGLISSRSPVTTLESRIKFKRGVAIQPTSEAELRRLVTAKPHSGNLVRSLSSNASVIALSPKLSRHMVDRLASISSNRGAMRAVAESLSSPRHFVGTTALQEDAVRTALKVFGLSGDDRAVLLELVDERETALARVGIREDSVIEHDARHVPGYDLVGSDLTGRAVFRRDKEQLEIFTANRRPLEQVFGVDLIYLNATKQNIVMLQYKMLEASRRGDANDWIYRPNEQLDEEISRMRLFRTTGEEQPPDYRLNSEIFYLKFVKRDGSLKNGGIITPLPHFERLCADPAYEGPNGGLRISYEALSGRYLRQGAFLDLVRSGYIGAHAETTEHLTSLVRAVLRNGRAVVAAVQQKIESDTVTDVEGEDVADVDW